MRAFVRHVTGEGGNCTTWSEEKKKIRGCGTTCDCPRLKEDFSRFDALKGYLTLVRDQYLSIEDISDADYEWMVHLMILEKEIADEREAKKEAVKRIFGTDRTEHPKRTH